MIFMTTAKLIHYQDQVIEVQSGLIAPAFGQIGFGTQHKLPMKVKDLESKGFIKK